MCESKQFNFSATFSQFKGEITLLTVVLAPANSPLFPVRDYDGARLQDSDVSPASY